MKEIAAALVGAQKAFGPALKTSTNPHFRSKYADLSACIEAVLDGLHANDIMLMQKCHEDSTGVTVETLFIHKSGETFSAGKLHVPAAKQDPQGYGSALTYARRYALMAACGIAPEDDDGNAASKPRQQEKKVTYLNQQQIDEITVLINETGTDFQAFMAWISKGAGVECSALNQVPSTAYAPAIKQLNAKKAK